MTLRVDPEGVFNSSLAEWEVEQQERLREAFGSDLSPSPQTPQSQIAGIQAFGLEETGEAAVNLQQAFSVDHADEVQLDALGSLLDIHPTDCHQVQSDGYADGGGWHQRAPRQPCQDRSRRG